MTALESTPPDCWTALLGLARRRALVTLAGPGLLGAVTVLLFQVLALPILAEASLLAADRAAVDLGLAAVRVVVVAVAVLAGAGAAAEALRDPRPTVPGLGARVLGGLVAGWATLGAGAVLFLLATGLHGLSVPSGLGVWLAVAALEVGLAVGVGTGTGAWLGRVGGALAAVTWIALGYGVRVLAALGAPSLVAAVAVLVPDPLPFDAQAVLLGAPVGPVTLLLPALHAAGWGAIGLGLALVAIRRRASRPATATSDAAGPR